MTCFLASVLSLSSLPYANAQRSETIQVGVASVLVKPDGRISLGEYADTTGYKYHYHNLVRGYNPPETSEGYLLVKDDGLWTYFGADIVGFDRNQGPLSIFFVFDTMNRGSMATAAEAVFTLNLRSDSARGSPIEEENLFPMGIYFFHVAQRGPDYDWQYYFGPSPRNSDPHPQFEIQVRSDILTKYAYDIGFVSGYTDAQGALSIPDLLKEDWAKLQFSPLKTTLITVLGVAAVLVIGITAYLRRRPSARGN